MATIGDVLRGLLHGDRLSPDNLADAEQAVTDFEAFVENLQATAATHTLSVPAGQPEGPAVLHVPVRIDAQGNVTQA